MKVSCYKCNKELEFDEKLIMPRGEECPFCYANIRSCRMCKFYDKYNYNECSEPASERVLDKEKQNFCAFYELGDPSSKEIQRKNTLTAAESLFKKR